MASIMQGTTPTLTITISADDFLLSDASAVELYVRNGDNTTTYTLDDLTIDTEANTVSHTFTEAETAAFIPSKRIIIQGRFWVANTIIGINKLFFTAADMMEVGADG